MMMPQAPMPARTKAAPIWAALPTRLLDLSPYAFKYVTGDLPTDFGLREMRVICGVGDAGLDVAAMSCRPPNRMHRNPVRACIIPLQNHSRYPHS